MANAGKYMCNVLEGRSNGPEKDRAWGWKREGDWKEAQRKEIGSKPRVRVECEFRDFEGRDRPAKL